MSQLSESSLKNLTNSLVEMVDLNGPAANSEFAPSHIQFHRFEKCDAQAELASESPSVWFVCSSGVPGRGDSYLSNLIFKSFRKGHFKAAAQVSFSTIISDIAQEKNLSKYRTLPDLLSSFPNNKVEGQELNKLGAFQKNFISWANKFPTKCLVTFSVGKAMLRHKNTPDEILSKVSEIYEAPIYEFGQEPDDFDFDPENITESFGQYVCSLGSSWIDVSLDMNKKSYDEFVSSEWKHNVGPLVKWFAEGEPYKPEEKSMMDDLEIIPPLEMPAEFMNF